MPIRSIITLLGLLIAIMAAPASAGAATVDDCQALLSAVRTDTATTATFTNANDQVGLLEKLDNASAALSAGKNAGAVRKLADFRVKAQTLASTGKLAAEDAARLDAEAAAAISCIESIGV